MLYRLSYGQAYIILICIYLEHVQLTDAVEMGVHETLIAFPDTEATKIIDSSAESM